RKGCRLGRVSCLAPPKSHKHCGGRESRHGLERVGDADRSAPKPRRSEDGLELIPIDMTALEKRGPGVAGRGQKRGPYIRAKGETGQRAEQRDRERRGDDRTPLTGSCERHRNHQTKLRLIGEETEQYASECRPALEESKTAADQRRAQEAVLAVAEIDEDCGT